MPRTEYQVRFIPADPQLEECPTSIGYYDAALEQAKAAQEHMVDLTSEDEAEIVRQGVLSIMKSWYLDTGYTFVLIEWTDGSKLVMEPASK